MASLVIPEEHYSGFAAIRDLPEEAMDSFVSVLEDHPARLDRAELRSSVSNGVDDAVRGEVESIMDTLVALYVLRDESDVLVEDFVDEVVDASQALNVCDWMLKSGVGAFIGLFVGRFAP